MDYARASTIELIDKLCEQERHPDLELIRVLLGRGDEVVPDLIEVVECDESWPQIHAALLLCELKVEEALPALQRAMSMPGRDGLVDWLVDDALDKFGPAALDMLEAVAVDKEVKWYPRAVSCRVMRTIALRDSEAYDRVTAFLCSLLPSPDLDWQSYESYEAITKAVDEPRIWTSVVGLLCDLRDPQAYDLIAQLFQSGLIDEMTVDRASYLEAYQGGGPPVNARRESVSLMERYERAQPRKASKSEKRTPFWARRKRKKRR